MKNFTNFHDTTLNRSTVSRTTHIIKSLMICALLLFAAKAMAQTIITIDNNPGSTTTYQTIQDAHDNATAGDIIYVQPSGTSYGSLNILKAITVVGRSHSEPSKVSQLGSITVRASGITLKGLQFGSLNYSSSGTPNTLPFVGLNIFECKFSSATLGVFSFNSSESRADSITIRGNLVSSSLTIYPDATDILMSNNIFNSSTISTFTTSSLVISNNIFRSSSSINIANLNPNGTLLLFNNMFISTAGNFNNASLNLSSGDFNLSNNLTYVYGGGTFSIQGTSNGTFLDNNTLANTNPLFTNIDTTVSQSFAGSSSYNPETRLEDDLTLQAGSPALTGGGGASELGLFNNGFLYKYLGNPRGIPTIDVLSYDGAVPKNGNINVTIKAKAH